MKEKSGCSGALFIFLSIANFIFAYFAYRGEHSAKPAKVISIINGKMSSVGSLGGSSKAVEMYSTLFYIFIVLGIIFLILSIVMFCAGESSKSENTNVNSEENAEKDKPRFIACPKCGELNSSNNTKCFKCKTDLIEIINKKETKTSNVWICPKCGRENQNYVGTCGCGEVKPK
ncbi:MULTISPECIES: zinc ribbon domain-containing protein [Ruminococcus]|uniref:Zinc ribbon domain-containing protein n=1 Tax=Ruminococcus bovis TaxID=2564099 RepID=A0A4P8XYW3_9FIRM|nr:MULTISPECIES: zinc ribbon domain-containing protein [Ruminococcus]MEE3439454.1 zinc ribbon domain-containing protein [Ruminococcus sp.]QCT07419.1 hypothetical protein E5Z56_08680 [Ruminococcus bovis]